MYMYIWREDINSDLICIFWSEPKYSPSDIQLKYIDLDMWWRSGSIRRRKIEFKFIGN